MLFAFTALMLASCGGNNTSGGGSSNGNPVNPIDGGGIIQGGNGQALPPNWREIVRRENPCRDGSSGLHQNRQIVQIPVQVQTNAGALHVGVTSMGDVAYVQNNGGGAQVTLEICQRLGMANTGHQFGNMILNLSRTCPVAEISQAYMRLSGQVPYEVNFRRIDAPNFEGQSSSLCQQMY